MSAGQWLGIAAVVVLIGAVFMGMRGGRRQYRADRQELEASAYAQGARDMEASLKAQLVNSVTVVAGNESRYDRCHDSADEPSRVLDGVPVGVPLPALASEQGLVSDEAFRVLLQAERLQAKLQSHGVGGDHNDSRVLRSLPDGRAGELLVPRYGPEHHGGLSQGVTSDDPHTDVVPGSPAA